MWTNGTINNIGLAGAIGCLLTLNAGFFVDGIRLSILHILTYSEEIWNATYEWRNNGASFGFAWWGVIIVLFWFSGGVFLAIHFFWPGEPVTVPVAERIFGRK